ncbi:MAG TPA: hypothetical protein V6C97_26495 [Oculatellaceae cyanobacterium]
MPQEHRCRPNEDSSIGWMEDNRRRWAHQNCLGLACYQGGSLLNELDTKAANDFGSEKKNFTPPVITASNGKVHLEGWQGGVGTSIAGPRRWYQHIVIDFAQDGLATKSQDNWFYKPGI